MLKQESNNIGSEENTRARACDTCRSTVCTVYCHADSAYLCTSCDTQVHSANRVASRHKRVPICESCECAPAAFLCEADDASLCTACDSDVHSANTVARRHHRVPVLPSSGNSYSSKASHHQTETTVVDPVVHQEEGDAKEAVYENSNQNNGLLFSDEYLDLADYNFKFTGQYNQHQQDCDVAQTNYGGDRVVPLQIHEESKGNLRHKQHNITHGSSENHYIYNGSINHNGNNTNMETDFVPEPTARDTEAARSKTPKGKTEQQLPDPLIIQLSPMDREARVLRYREKRKARKFEKTIRYASRKAYAERRPRINGRFAKMSETEEDYDQGFNSVLMLDTGYGTVPSF